MKNKLRCLFIALALLAGINQAAAQGTTAFTYQGQLHDGGTNANGVYTMTFALYDDPGSGNQIGGTVTTTPTLANGLFTVNLDFGAGAFDGSARWLDITISEGGTTQDLSPRVQVLPAPYALFANTATNLSGTLGGGQLAGIYSNTVTLNNPGNYLSGNGVGLRSVNATMLDGLDSSNYVQLAYDSATGDNDLIYSKLLRFASDVNVFGIASFSTNSYFYGSAFFQNSAFFNAPAVFYTNLYCYANASFVNTAYFFGGSVFSNNVIFNGTAYFNQSQVFQTNAYFGANIYVGPPSSQWQIGQAQSIFGATTVPNSLGFSTGGTLQMAIAPPGVTVNNQPAGATIFGTLSLENGSLWLTSGNISMTKGNLDVANGGFTVDHGSTTLGGNVRIYGSATVTTDLSCGGTFTVTGNASFGDFLGVVGNVSAANVYANNLVYATIVGGNAVAAKSLSSLKGQDILNQVASLPISTWESKSDAKTHHVGPMAHDFQAAFGLGKDDQTISLVDEGGVALAAIQGLNEKLKEKLKEKDAQIATLNKRLDDLEQIVKTFAQK